MTRSVDYSPLISPVTKDEVARFKVETKASGVSWGGNTVMNAVGLGCAFVVIAAVGMVAIGGIFTRQISASFESSAPAVILGVVAPIAFLAAIVALAVFAIRRMTAGRWEKWMRMSRFGAANGLTFSASSPNPQYPGAIFGLGSGRVAKEHLRATSGRFLDMGNYEYTTGSGKNRTTHHWGFMALHLDRRLPNMMLDAKANNSWFGTNLPSTFGKEQVLSLEGDFDRHFTLYCPKAYERDALYVFTPDLMALLIDEAGAFDVEIVDDWMLVYSSAKFDTGTPALYQRLFRIVDTVGAKTLSQTDRYVDERIGSFDANVIAPQGRRLRKGFPVAAVITVVVFLAIWIGPRILEALN